MTGSSFLWWASCGTQHFSSYMIDKNLVTWLCSPENSLEREFLPWGSWPLWRLGRKRWRQDWVRIEHWLSLSCWPPKQDKQKESVHTLSQHTEPGSRPRDTWGSFSPYIASESKVSALGSWVSCLGMTSCDLVTRVQVTDPCIPKLNVQRGKR